MKLISVKILGENFRSLTANKEYRFKKSSFQKDRLSTKIFAGLNGSGKSNFLELFAEIFYYLEIYHLSSVNKSDKAAKGFGFEIAYFLPLSKNDVKELYGDNAESEDYMHIRIKKNIDEEKPEFVIKKVSDESFIRVDKNTHLLLPTKIVAYTSGENELLSNPFYKIRYRHFKEYFEKNQLSENKYDRLVFLDYNSNFSIFIANLLFPNEQKIKHLKKIFKVEGLHSFRITFNYLKYRNIPIKLSDTINEKIEKLKLCATTWIEKKKKNENILILDFWINEASTSAIRFHFASSFNLFKTFYDLETLNLHLVPKSIRDMILKGHKWFNLSDEMPNADPSKLVFRIEKIKVNKIIGDGTEKVIPIFYKQLSDGEHQFNQVIGSILMMKEDGCLFLLDEPGTHFNPMWRAKMIQLLNLVTAKNYSANEKIEEVRKQEIIITTHSPFVISDTYKEDVYKFEKKEGKIIFENPKIKTYGASIGLILESIFGRDVSISDLSNSDLQRLKESIKTVEDLKRVKRELLRFGESVEKFDAYSFLQEKEEELKGNK